jgi:hypothetical protein
VLYKYPLMLARDVRYLAEGSLQSARTAYSRARLELADHFEPHAIEEKLRAYAEEGARLTVLVPPGADGGGRPLWGALGAATVSGRAAAPSVVRRRASAARARAGLSSVVTAAAAPARPVGVLPLLSSLAAGGTHANT